MFPLKKRLDLGQVWHLLYEQRPSRGCCRRSPRRARRRSVSFVSRYLVRSIAATATYRSDARTSTGRWGLPAGLLVNANPTKIYLDTLLHVIILIDVELVDLHDSSCILTTQVAEGRMKRCRDRDVLALKAYRLARLRKTPTVGIGLHTARKR